MDTDVPPILEPCAICARTFMPQSLEKHIRVCERQAAKKRKPFDSSKQRIQGTELAEFLPKQERKRHYPDERTTKPNTSWKETHHEFLQAIRAAREEVDPVESPSQRQSGGSLVTSGAPTRSNEQGLCPTCNRHFGIKAYERHVAWCKERTTRVVLSSATNVAKGRLEARMSYRAPLLKSRRAITREKYSPSAAAAQNTKSSPIVSAKPKESSSAPTCNKSADSTPKQKAPLVRRPAPGKESPSSSGPMKSRQVDRMDSGAFKDYDPFLLAEQQMNELLSDTSDQSVTDGPPTPQNHDTLFPLSPSSAFVKYPYQTHSAGPGKRSSLIAPPTEFDDLTSDFSSDSTETNSLSREIFLKDLKESNELKQTLAKSPEQKSPTRELGRRVIIDKSKVLGGEVVEDCAARSNKNLISNTERGRKILGKVTPKVVKPTVNRSLSIRAASAPKPASERKNPCTSPGSAKKVSPSKDEVDRGSNAMMNNRNSNYMGLSGSNLSLSSIVSSEVDMKRSNSVFEELMTSFEDENGPFPSLRSLLKSDSLSLSSPVHDSRQRNGQLSDEDFSSPENYKRAEHSKHSADSAYSSLNRKYSQHGRTINDMTGRLGEELPRTHRRDSGSSSMCKLPNFCHACGTRFQETAKYCCECGLQRLAL